MAAQGLYAMIEQLKKSEPIFLQAETRPFPKKTNARERALLLANHVAAINMGEPSTLSQSEYDKLLNSFQTGRDIKVYNRIKEIDRCVRSVLPYLNQLRLTHNEEIAIIWGCYNLVRTFLLFEDVINQALGSIEDEEKKNNVARHPALINNFIKFNLNKNGELSHEFIPVSSFPKIGGPIYTEGITLSEIIDMYRDRLEEGAVTIKSYIRAVKDYLISEDVEIEAYWTKLNDIEESMRQAQNFINTEKTSEKKIGGTNAFYRAYDELSLSQVKYDHFKESYLL